MTAAGTAARKAKGAIQYRRLTPLGGTGLSALGLGLSSPASAAPPNRDSAPSYAAVVANAAAGFAVDFDDAPQLPRGALVLGRWGFAGEAVLARAALKPLAPYHAARPSTSLGVLGMPGRTAYYGVRRLLRPRRGEVVFVSAGYITSPT